MKQSKYKYTFTYLVTIFIVFILFYCIFYNLVKPYQIDYNFHVFDIYTNDFYSGDFYRHNNIFRYLLNLCYIVNLDLRSSASFILSLFVLIRFICFFTLTKSIPFPYRILLCLSLCLIMPINFGSVEKTYLGKFAGNIWHNPTYITMMAFAPLCIVFFKKYYISQNQSKLNVILLSISIFLCALSKPSFIIAFIPSCALYLSFDYFFYHKNVKTFLNNIISGIIVCIPTLVFIIAAYLLEFNEGDNHIIFNFFGVWSFYAGRKMKVLFNFIVSSIPGSILLFVNKDNKKNNMFYLLILIVGLMYFSLFAESLFFQDANFAWTYASSILMFNSFLLIDYYSSAHRNKLLSAFIIIILVLECFSGARYIYALASNLIPL